MSEAMRDLLFGYLLGALDESEQELVESRLQFDPVWRKELGKLRERLARLDAVCAKFGEVEPPPGLASRTCEAIFNRPKAAAGRLRDSLSPATAPAVGRSHLTLSDVSALACVAVVALLLVLPAVQTSRFNGKVVRCQDNLRDLGVALTQFSENHGGYFPRVPTQGKLGVAGIYAPTLVRSGLLHESRKVVCPASTLADQGEFTLANLDSLKDLSGDDLQHLLPTLGGSYGYSLGHVESGDYRDIRNQRRTTFAVMADEPSPERPDGLGPSHGGRGINVLFEDGHTQFVTSTRLGGGDDIFSNDAGQIAAGLHGDDAVVVPSATAPGVLVNPHP